MSGAAILRGRSPSVPGPAEARGGGHPADPAGSVVMMLVGPPGAARPPR
ncbi:hypothetical protein QJS66_10910 [Kocuria rhizophila]|nr:hypothetical protein QJS66_10910 [Kocuria rhizophila]